MPARPEPSRMHRPYTRTPSRRENAGTPRARCRRLTGAGVSHDDAAAVYPELVRLKSEGFNIWYDEGIEAGLSWREEVATMRDRINGLRKVMSEKIAASDIEKDFSFLQRQSGMFSFLGLSVDQVRRLREELSIYTVDSARINVASFNDSNIDYFVEALQQVL